MAHEPEANRPQSGRRAAYRRGFLVLVGLAVLTGLEFLIAGLTNGSTVFLFIIGLLKAGIILQYFMHIYSLWAEEESH